MSNDRSEELKGLLAAGNFAEAMTLINNVTDYHEGEHFVFTVLRNEQTPQELVEAALTVFLATRENHYQQHGYWVHSLSHFTDTLWARRMDSWIARFNEVAFIGANELRDSNCSDRLVDDFAKFAKWNDDPKSFNLTSELLAWNSWEYGAYAKARIEAGKFASEVDFLCWRLRQTETLVSFDCSAQMDLVSTKEINELIGKLVELGADVSEFADMLPTMLTKQLSELEAKLPTASPEWIKERVIKAIAMTKEALASK